MDKLRLLAIPVMYEDTLHPSLTVRPLALTIACMDIGSDNVLVCVTVTALNYADHAKISVLIRLS